MAKFNNPMKVITGVNTRWSYANVWEAKSINGGTPKFSVSLIIPKSDTQTVEKIKAAIQAAYQEGEAKLKGNSRSVPALSAIKTPLRDGDVERPDDPAYAKKSVRMMKHMQTATSSTQTAPRLLASWMPTDSRSSTDPRCTPAFTAGRPSTCMLSIRTATGASPAV